MRAKLIKLSCKAKGILEQVVQICRVVVANYKHDPLQEQQLHADAPQRHIGTVTFLAVITLLFTFQF